MKSYNLAITFNGYKWLQPCMWVHVQWNTFHIIIACTARELFNSNISILTEEKSSLLSAQTATYNYRNFSKVDHGKNQFSLNLVVVYGIRGLPSLCIFASLIFILFFFLKKSFVSYIETSYNSTQQFRHLCQSSVALYLWNCRRNTKLEQQQHV